jgi:hypothetical protein
VLLQEPDLDGLQSVFEKFFFKDNWVILDEPLSKRLVWVLLPKSFLDGSPESHMPEHPFEHALF